MPDILGAAWNVTSDLSNYIEAVHRLNQLGAVMTHVTNETSQDGFHAEWRVISPSNAKWRLGQPLRGLRRG